LERSSPFSFINAPLPPTIHVPSLEPAESILKTQERCGEEPNTEEPSTHIPSRDSQGANSVRPQVGHQACRRAGYVGKVKELITGIRDREREETTDFC
jgi:hypothetical protein